MKKYILALDQGTTSSRAIVFDGSGRAVSTSQKEFRQIYPQAGWVEHDPDEIWQSQLECAREALRLAGAAGDEVAAIGLTNQRETTIVWSALTGRPIYNAIVWQCRRTAERAEEAASGPLGRLVREKCGVEPDAYFSATKIEWILKNVPGAMEAAERGELRFGTVDSWLIWKLTDGREHLMDRTNASRTMLYDIHKFEWCGELLDAFGVPRSMLPEVRPSGAGFGMTAPELFGTAIPIAAAAGDQHAALFGQCCFAPGEAKNTYGTGCFLLMNTGAEAIESKNRLITTLAATEDERPEYALEGSVFVAGAAVQWLRDEMGLISSAAESEPIARSVPDTAGVYLVPAFTGLGAPYWDAYARGTIVGITRGTGRAHIVRAALEGIAYQAADVLRAMEADTGRRLPSLRVDGGASMNAFLMQFQADILDVPVQRPGYAETTALGAAYLAGLNVGMWSGRDELRSMAASMTEFVPSMEQSRREALLAGWRVALGRALR